MPSDPDAAHRGRSPGRGARDHRSYRGPSRFSFPISVFAYVQDGRLRALGITGEARSSIFPDIASVAELGFPNLQMSTWFGIVGPAGLPAPVIKKLNEQFIRAAQSAAVTQMVVLQAAEVFTATPEQFSAMMARDIVQLHPKYRTSLTKIETAELGKRRHCDPEEAHEVLWIARDAPL
jgi:Tripartite tricarboxylate transporter family receptor